MTSADERAETVFGVFYSTARMGAERLSDGGGPFGFDITVALQIDGLVAAYECDGIVETGCHRGDTTAYLAACYPHLQIVSCDIDPDYAAFTKLRLREAGNVTILTGDSAVLLPRVLDGLNCPLVYLDAHWGERWPLADELTAVRRGLVAVDDFDIGHPRFGYDTYRGRRCGPELIRTLIPDIQELWVGDPHAEYPFPCLQVGRRSGTAYLPVGLDPDVLEASKWFIRVPVRPKIVWPNWATRGLRE